MRVLGAGERNHGEAVRERSKVLLEFVRRTAGGNEMDFVEIKTAIGGAGDGEMTVVNRVEAARINRDQRSSLFAFCHFLQAVTLPPAPDRVAGKRRSGDRRWLLRICARGLQERAALRVDYSSVPFFVNSAGGLERRNTEAVIQLVYIF